jgi:uncharacterized protein DUF498/DUF598
MQVGGLGAGKDFKLYPGGGRAWDWAETGTRHSPGIQPGDIQELVDRGATTVVLSRGMNRRLHVPPATRRYLEQRPAGVHVAETREAVKIYNDLAEPSRRPGSSTPPADLGCRPAGASRSHPARDGPAARQGSGPASARARALAAGSYG